MRAWSVAALGCLVAALLSNLPLFLAGRLFCSEDLNAYYRWSEQFARAVEEGALRPRWDAGAAGGLGSPAFLYLSPLFFYAVAIIRALGAGTWLAMRIVVFLTSCCAGLVAWRGLRRWIPDGWALAGAAVLQINPFLLHLISLHNLFPFYVSFLPLTWLVLTTLKREGEGRLSPAVALAMAALVLTHQLAAFMALLTLPFIFLPGCFRAPRPAFKAALAWGLSCLLGLGLAAYYLLPAMTTQHLIASQEWFEPRYIDWRNSFILPWITSTRFGVRYAGVQWILGGGMVLALVVLLLARRGGRSGAEEGAPMIAAVWAPLGAALFLAWDGSYFLWKWTPFLQKVQWPYRFLLPGWTFGLAGLVWIAADRQSVPRHMALVARGLLLLGVLLNFALQAKNLPIAMQPDFSRLKTQEYLRVNAPPGWASYIEAGGWEAECRERGVWSRTIVREAHQWEWEVESNHNALLRLPLFAFPAWKVQLDGNPVASIADPETGLLSVQIPSGRHRIVVVWSPLRMEKAGGVISAICLAGWVWAAMRRRGAGHREA